MERQMIERHFRELSQRARLTEFAFSESGEMLAEKAAQIGAVLAASTLAGLLMSAGTVEASCPLQPCADDQSCATLIEQPWCRTVNCNGCAKYCTADPNPGC